MLTKNLQKGYISKNFRLQRLSAHRLILLYSLNGQKSDLNFDSNWYLSLAIFCRMPKSHILKIYYAEHSFASASSPEPDRKFEKAGAGSSKLEKSEPGAEPEPKIFQFPEVIPILSDTDSNRHKPCLLGKNV